MERTVSLENEVSRDSGSGGATDISSGIDGENESGSGLSDDTEDSGSCVGSGNSNNDEARNSASNPNSKNKAPRVSYFIRGSKPPNKRSYRNTRYNNFTFQNGDSDLGDKIAERDNSEDSGLSGSDDEGHESGIGEDVEDSDSGLSNFGEHDKSGFITTLKADIAFIWAYVDDLVEDMVVLFATYKSEDIHLHNKQCLPDRVSSGDTHESGLRGDENSYNKSYGNNDDGSGFSDEGHDDGSGLSDDDPVDNGSSVLVTSDKSNIQTPSSASDTALSNTMPIAASSSALADTEKQKNDARHNIPNTDDEDVGLSDDSDSSDNTGLSDGSIHNGVVKDKDVSDVTTQQTVKLDGEGLGHGGALYNADYSGLSDDEPVVDVTFEGKANSSAVIDAGTHKPKLDGDGGVDIKVGVAIDRSRGDYTAGNHLARDGERPQPRNNRDEADGDLGDGDLKAGGLDGSGLSGEEDHRDDLVERTVDDNKAQDSKKSQNGLKDAPALPKPATAAISSTAKNLAAYLGESSSSSPSDSDMSWEDDADLSYHGDLSDNDDIVADAEEDWHVSHMKITLRPGMRVYTTEKYMADAPKKGSTGTYVRKHETESNYGMFSWDDYTNPYTDTNECVAPLFAVDFLDKHLRYNRQHGIGEDSEVNDTPDKDARLKIGDGDTLNGDLDINGVRDIRTNGGEVEHGAGAGRHEGNDDNEANDSGLSEFDDQNDGTGDNEADQIGIDDKNVYRDGNGHSVNISIDKKVENERVLIERARNSGLDDKDAIDFSTVEDKAYGGGSVDFNTSKLGPDRGLVVNDADNSGLSDDATNVHGVTEDNGASSSTHAGTQQMVNFDGRGLGHGAIDNANDSGLSDDDPVDNGTAASNNNSSALVSAETPKTVRTDGEGFHRGDVIDNADDSGLSDDEAVDDGVVEEGAYSSTSKYTEDQKAAHIDGDRFDYDNVINHRDGDNSGLSDDTSVDNRDVGRKDSNRALIDTDTQKSVHAFGGVLADGDDSGLSDDECVDDGLVQHKAGSSTLMDTETHQPVHSSGGVSGRGNILGNGDDSGLSDDGSADIVDNFGNKDNAGSSLTDAERQKMFHFDSKGLGHGGAIDNADDSGLSDDDPVDNKLAEGNAYSSAVIDTETPKSGPDHSVVYDNSDDSGLSEDEPVDNGVAKDGSYRSTSKYTEDQKAVHIDSEGLGHEDFDKEGDNSGLSEDESFQNSVVEDKAYRSAFMHDAARKHDLNSGVHRFKADNINLRDDDASYHGTQESDRNEFGDTQVHDRGLNGGKAVGYDIAGSEARTGDRLKESRVSDGRAHIDASGVDKGYDTEFLGGRAHYNGLEDTDHIKHDYHDDNIGNNNSHFYDGVEDVLDSAHLENNNASNINHRRPGEEHANKNDGDKAGDSCIDGGGEVSGLDDRSRGDDNGFDDDAGEEACNSGLDGEDDDEESAYTDGSGLDDDEATESAGVVRKIKSMFNIFR